MFYQSGLLDFLHGVFLIWFYILLLFQFYLSLSFKTFYFWSVWETLYLFLFFFFFFKNWGCWGAGEIFRAMESTHIYKLYFLSTWLAYTWLVENHLMKKRNFIVEELKMPLEAPLWITTVWKTGTCYGNFEILSSVIFLLCWRQSPQPDYQFHCWFIT